MDFDPTLADAERLDLVVAGAHLSGQPLNHQLTDRGGELVETTTTAPTYRLYALRTDPPKPGLVRSADGGRAIEVEVWSLPPAELGTFVAAVPAPLAIGQVELADGSWRTGFTCMPHGRDGATEITEHGGWRSYLARR
jgi:allophanate hydrolase